MRRSILMRVLTIVICITLIATYNLPVAGSLTSPIPSQETGEVTDASVDKAALTAKIVAEDLSKRTETSKEFRRSDGSSLMALYGQPVHYLANGDWEDIDNTLISSKSKTGDDVLVNKAGSFQVELPAYFSPEKAIYIHSGSYTLSFSFEGTFPAIRNIVKDFDESLTKGLTAEQQKILPTKLESSVQYSDVLPGTDFEYTVASDQLKETIVLHSLKDTKASYSFAIDTSGLDAVLLNDNTIEFFPQGKKDGDPIFMIPAPFMTDSEGEYSYAIDVTLDQSSGCRLTYTPSAEWLSDKQRVWPVAIDPVIYLGHNDTNIKDQQVDSANNSVNYLSAYLECGRNQTYGIERIYMMYQNLPSLTTSDTIIDASIQVYRGSSNTVQAQIEVHKVNATWQDSTLQWSNKPGYDTNVEDYQVVYYAGWYTWKITDIARGWYTGQNTGMMFKQTDAIENTNNPYYYKQFYSTNYSSSYRPLLTITFRNSNGLEDYWSYHNYSLSHGGSLAINDFNGNPVFSQALASTPGSLAPASLGLVFNGSARNTVDSTLGWGKGWRSVYDQKVAYVSYGTSPAINYYTYLDGDGTTHYFYDNGGTWYNEEGLDLTLATESIDGNSYITITDKSGNRLVFYLLTHATLPGRLKEIRDATNQANRTIKLTYSQYGASGPYCLSAVKDGTDHQITITRASTTGLIDSVSDPAGRVTDLTLDANGYLTNVLFPDGFDTDFAYDANANLSTVTDCDNRRYTISYTSSTGLSGTVYRVQQVQESETATSTLGQKSIFSYGRNTTTVEDESGLKSIYQFNSLGNCINAIGPDGSAGLSSYGNELPGVDGGVNSTRNKPEQISMVQKFITNKVKNHNFELTSDWPLYVDPANDGTVARSTDQKFSGAYSLKIVKNSTTNQNYGFQWATAEKGKTYTASVYVKTNGVSSSTHGALLEASYYNSSGGRVLVFSHAVTGTADWQRISVTFTIPADSTSTNISVAPMMRYATGTAWFDCVQVEEGCVPNRYNLIENTDFDYVTSSLPNYWTRGSYYNSNDIVLTAADDTNPPQSSDNCYQIEGVFNQGKTLNQTLSISGSAGDIYVMGAWAKGYAVPIETAAAQYEPTSRDFGIQILFVNGSNTEWLDVDFNPCLPDWQYISREATAPTSYTSIQIRVVYGAGVSKVKFDGIQVYKENFGSDYSYDTNGNLTVSNSANGSSSTSTYVNNNLTNVTLPTGGDIDYSYDGYHRPTGATSASSVLFGMAYNATTGHLTESKEGSASTYVRTTSEYSTATGYGSRYLTKVTDPFGKNVLYGYDTDRGLNTSVTQPNGQVISHTYQNSSGLLTGASAIVTGLGTVTNGYSYGNNSRLTEIRHSTAGADVVYGFVYNALGWLTGVSLGGNTLVTNTYQANTGRLDSIAYGNSQTVNYSYDTFDRVIGVSLGTTQKYTFGYDATGQVGYMNDMVQNKQYWYLSDLAGRLSEIRRSDGNSTRYTYNASNQVTALNETISGTNFSSTYSYDNDQRMIALASGLLSAAVGYDTTNNLDRVLTISRAYNGVNKITTTYGYQDGALDTSVTPAVQTTSKRIASVTNGSKAQIVYTYDDNGNISTIEQGTDVCEYFYDGLNQIVRENVSVAGATPYTHVFVYDVGGNIQSKSNYTYVADNQTLGTLLSTDTYVYSDTSWADKLTSYNGIAMTYDAIGNPLTWTDPNGAWTATWTMGRQLATLSKTGTNISYKYGADGIRTEKTLNGVTTIYNVVGGVVTWEKTGTNPAIHYNYDANGNLFSMEYNGANYFYVRNAQNDVIGLVEASSGNWAAQYIYDAWGKPLAILDGSGNDVSNNTAHIANLNPYRYRGYRFDAEIGMYYIGNRYLCLQTSRWLNSDNIIDGNSLQSQNMFQYCGNNPVNNIDPSGNSIQSITKYVGQMFQSAAAGTLTVLKSSMLASSSSGKIAVASICALATGTANLNDVVTDIRNYNFYNGDARKVLDSRVFSSYRGTPVIRHCIPGITSFSIANTIVLNTGTPKNEEGMDTLNHEWGHNVQATLIGPLNFINRIAAPSVIQCAINKVSNNEYYSSPWERSADFFGGVNRGSNYYSPGSLDKSLEYLYGR